MLYVRQTALLDPKSLSTNKDDISSLGVQPKPIVYLDTFWISFVFDFEDVRYGIVCMIYNRVQHF